MVERCVRDAEAAGSNPVASTKNPNPTFWSGLDFLYFAKAKTLLFITLFPFKIAKCATFALNLTLDNLFRCGILFLI